MKLMDWVLLGFQILFGYGFIYYAIFSIKNPVDLWLSSIILLVLAYAAALCCPWLKYTDGWKRMWK